MPHTLAVRMPHVNQPPVLTVVSTIMALASGAVAFMPGISTQIALPLLQGLSIWGMKSMSISSDMTQVFDFICPVLAICIFIAVVCFITDVKVKGVVWLCVAFFCFMLFHQQKLSDFKDEDFGTVLTPIYKTWFIEQTNNQSKVNSKGKCVVTPNKTTCGELHGVTPAMPIIGFRPAVKNCSQADLERLVHEIRFGDTNDMLLWTMQCWKAAELTGSDYCANLVHMKVSPGVLQQYCPYQVGEFTKLTMRLLLMVLAVDILLANAPVAEMFNVDIRRLCATMRIGQLQVGT